jgi:long-chain acyl-CoA synthetase
MQNQFTRVFDILLYQKDRYSQDSAVNTFSDNRWQPTSISELIIKVDTVSCWLIGKGYKKGDKLAIMPNQGTLDWLVIDFACQQVGIIIIPLHPTYSEEELKSIFAETTPVLIIVANNSLTENVSKVTESEVYTLEPKNSQSFTLVYEQIASANQKEELVTRKLSVKEDDVLSIMYTSGTSGLPKGAILTHKNMVSNILFTLAAFPLESAKKVMSYLPFSHILERSAAYAYLACGANIYFVRNKETFLEDFQSAKPYFSTSVPRVLEKMYAHLQEKTLAQNLLKRNLVNWVLKTAKEYNKHPKKSILLTVKLFFARLLVLNRWKNQLGGKLQCMVVGAASLRPEIARMFSAAGIRIREGYGMTEASPLISLNRFSPGLNKFGTVGIPIPAINLKIKDQNDEGEGEILIKGPNVMQGYFNRPDLNNEVFTKKGWFKTGDVGKLIDGKFLQITDRKKDIFKTSSGKYIAPQPMENLINSSRFILQSLVIGFNRPFVIALLVPDFNMLKEWCLSKEIHWTAPTYMVHNIKVREKYDKEVANINEDLAGHKKIRTYILCDEEWSTSNKLITNTLKPIRKSLLNLYDKEINKIYS